VRIVVFLHAPRGAGPATLGLDDAHALAAALALPGEHTVTALLAGLSSEDAPLHRALAAGVGRAVRVVGEDFGSADFHTLGQALGTAVKRVGADLVLAGARSVDDGLDAVPAALARQVGAQFVACAEGVAPGTGSSVELTVRGGGRRRRVAVPTPAVVSVIASSRTAPALPDRPAEGRTIDVISLVDPEATVVRRRTELLGQPELPQRATEDVASADAFVAALTR
jgi:electron transfer flavoprotein alpha/beta subunit